MKIAVFYENIYDGAIEANKRPETVLEDLTQQGLKMIYLSPASWRRDEKWLAPLLERLGLAIEGMHVHLDFVARPDTLEYRDIVDLASGCGAGNLLIVPGMLSGRNTAEAVQRMLDGMRRTTEYGQRRGLPILMEDYDSLISPYNSIAGLDWFLSQVEGLGCAFDTGNFVAFHEDEMQALERFRSRIVTVHLKDRVHVTSMPCEHAFICANGEAVHTCPVGKGFIRIDEILQSLRESGYSGNVIAELYGCDSSHLLEDLSSSLAYLRAKTGEKA